MTQKLFLTSAVALSFVAPAIAEPTYTGTFPSTGLMEADYTYTNAATETNMGVYEGSVDAEAQYTNIDYSVAAGLYLTGVDNNNDATTATCTSGNFCPGVQSTTYENNAFGNTGLQSCSTATSGSYTLSDAGASSSDQCYRTCDGNVSILHATGVSGNDYSDGTNTCEPTGCDNGYHVKPATPDLTTVIGTSEAGTGYTSNDSTGSKDDTDGMSNSVISGDSMAFAVDYGNKGMIKGHGRCSKTGVTTPWNTTNGYTFASDHFVNNLADETDPENSGQYCYCHLDSYTPVSGSAIALSGPWVFYYADVDAVRCANDCAGYCAGSLQSGGSRNLAFRGAVFGSVESGPAMCEAHVITITWGDTDLADVTANEAGTATYGSDIRTPVKAQTKAGKRFTGWRFSAPQQTQLP